MRPSVETPHKRNILFHPWVIALYPIVFLYSANFTEVLPRNVWPLALGMLALATVLYVGINALLHAPAASAALTSLIMLVFFSYGQAAAVMPDALAVILLMGIALVAGAALIHWRSKVPRISYIFNIMSLALVVIPAAFIALGLFRTIQHSDLTLQLDIPDDPARAPVEPLPDVYYIILDEYPRQDELADRLDFDNTPFIDALRERGFVIADESLSNYSITPLSIASSLNMQYLDAFTSAEGGGITPLHLYPWVKESAVTQAFRDHGYTYVHVSSGWELSDSNPAADVNVEFTTEGRVVLEGGQVMRSENPFLALLMQSSMVGPLLPPLSPTTGNVLPFYHPDRTVGAFDYLGEVAGRDEPTFTFYHAVSPHYPFIFAADGSVVEKPSGWTWQDDQRGDIDLFVGQVQAINEMVLAAVDAILAESDTPPIIVIQGDHGFTSATNLILNAYHLPGDGADLIYPSITPVNSFRLILDHYLGTNLGLIDDRAYFSVEQYGDPFKVELVEP